MMRMLYWRFPLLIGFLARHVTTNGRFPSGWWSSCKKHEATETREVEGGREEGMEGGNLLGETDRGVQRAEWEVRCREKMKGRAKGLWSKEKESIRGKTEKLKGREWERGEGKRNCTWEMFGLWSELGWFWNSSILTWRTCRKLQKVSVAPACQR